VVTPFEHRPVLLDEVVELFAPVPGGVVVDATVGGGGHARAVLAAHDHLRVLGLDRDADAVDAARNALAPFGARAQVVQARFDRLEAVLLENGHDSASGVLFDLGVSSPQLDRADRGFSFRREGPLDMRMDLTQERRAADLVNELGEDELTALLQQFGDERHARRIARAIVRHRPLQTTLQLESVIRAAIPAAARRRGGHPARRTFQALRIAVNDELSVLQPALEQAVRVLRPGGRCVAIAYHSGEDRIVKDTFAVAATGGCTCPPGLPCVCGARPVVRLMRRGARKASPPEVEVNPRAESARLRAVEKLAPPDGDAA
jgi:16S rRNA (cytosine1402-N4)-methyltransferase